MVRFHFVTALDLWISVVFSLQWPVSLTFNGQPFSHLPLVRGGGDWY